MKEIQIFRSPQFGQVRIIRDDASGELLFCANDVTTALGYANGRDAVSKHVEKDDVAKRDMGVVTGKKSDGTDAFQIVSTTFVTESGLYSLIFGSKQERAKEFKHWVTSEVLPAIRKTGSYHAQQPPSLTEQVSADLAFADWNIKQFNLNEASKLNWARTIGDKFGLATEALPLTINAGTEHPTTHSTTFLLKEHNVQLSAITFNKILAMKGVVKQTTRPGKNGKVHKWMILTPEYAKYGENQQHPHYQKQTQIAWYDNLFDEFLTEIGLVNKEQSLDL